MKILSTLYYYYKRQKWMFSYPFANRLHDNVIQSPIFIVGHQGNGATLVSRIIRRADQVVTFSGNSNYFTGADEMQSGMGICLDYRLTGLLHKVPKSNKFGSRRGWSYACDELLPFYKFSEKDCDLKLKKNLKKCIKTAILSNCLSKSNVRFVDKSQSYAIKIPMIMEALSNHAPLFIGIVRNPLAVCWRAAYLKTGLSKEHFSVEEKLKVAVQHWNNSVECMLKERDKNNFILIKIEDIVSNLSESMQSIFSFINVEFKSEYLPHQHDKLPFGTKRSERWYPVRTEINEKYVDSLPNFVREYILDHCKTNMEKIGYI